MALALRTDTYFEKVKAWVEKEGFGGFAVREVAGDNEHWHWILHVGSKSIKQVRNSLMRNVKELSGNGAYSLTECRDKDKYERYMCKGDAEGTGVSLAWRNGLEYSDEKLEELHAAYYTENKKLKRKATGTMIDYVVDECKRKSIGWRKRDEMAKIYIKEQTARGKPLNLFAARATLNTVQVVLGGEEAFEEFARFLEQI